MKKKKIAVISALVLASLAGWIAFCGYQWSWGPFHKLHNLKTSALPGNSEVNNIENITQNEKSSLKGKTIFFLGSSVTYGAASGGVSFADYIAARNNCTCIKEAVSGTTLVDEGLNSYISRLNKADTSMNVDIFVCQLSTNDATQKKEPGKVIGGDDITAFDTHTIAGAIEYIITFAQKNWNCPVVFYTNSYYNSERYSAMVSLLSEIAGKHNITIIDMYGDKSFNDIDNEHYSLYMADEIHPTKAGYLEWWTPFIEEKLEALTGE